LINEIVRSSNRSGKTGVDSKADDPGVCFRQRI
jgi:hypothetical protein